MLLIHWWLVHGIGSDMDPRRGFWVMRSDLVGAAEPSSCGRTDFCGVWPMDVVPLDIMLSVKVFGKVWYWSEEVGRSGRTYPSTRLMSQSSGRHNFCTQTPNWVNQNSIWIFSTRTSHWFYKTKHLRLFVKLRVENWDLTTINTAPHLALCSSSSKNEGPRWKQNSNGMKQAYEIFRTIPCTCQLWSVYHAILGSWRME
jgi:hypothetical protein